MARQCYLQMIQELAMALDNDLQTRGLNGYEKGNRA